MLDPIIDWFKASPGKVDTGFPSGLATEENGMRYV